LRCDRMKILPTPNPVCSTTNLVAPPALVRRCFTSRISVSIQVVGLLLLVVASDCKAQVIPEQAKAVAEIEKLRDSRITLGEEGQNRVVIGVDLEWTHENTDAVLEHLKSLSTVRSLRLKDTNVTDAGLVPLKGLSNLETLDLGGNMRVSDAGLGYLKGLTKLRSLEVWATDVTDAGLIHPKGFTNLKRLDLRMTKLTDTGLQHLEGLRALEWLGTYPSVPIMVETLPRW